MKNIMTGRKNLLYLKGSISIEAAMILPVFIIAIVTVISLGFAMIFHVKLQNAICEEAKILSLRCFDGRVEALSVVESEIKSILDDNNTKYIFINGGWEGIDFSESFLDDNEYFVISAKYYYMPLGGELFGFNGFGISQKCVMHNWCGYINGYSGENIDLDYAYVTDNSSVYHLNRECSHIRLTVTMVKQEILISLRNSAGGKYYPCEICHGNSADGNIYITSDGNRYHGSASCSGLKRKVSAIRLSQIGDRRPCSRCAR